MILGRMVAQEISEGKDTPTGHHEIMGIIDREGWHRFEKLNLFFQKTKFNNFVG